MYDACLNKENVFQTKQYKKGDTLNFLNKTSFEQ